MRRGDPVDTAPLFEFVVAGNAGTCGHRHRHVDAAERCLDRHRSATHRAGTRDRWDVYPVAPGGDVPAVYRYDDRLRGVGRTLQERMLDETGDPFWLLAACVLLNRTPGYRAEPVLYEILDRWPTPDDLRRAPTPDLEETVGRLGFGERRARLLRLLAGTWRRAGYDTLPPAGIPVSGLSTLPAVGRYAVDSWRLFVLGDPDVDPDDPVLRARRPRVL